LRRGAKREGFRQRQRRAYQGSRDRIIDGSWGELSCLKCGACYRRDTPLLFTDLPGRVWIVQYERSERRRFTVLEDEANGIFELEFIQRPPAAIRQQALAVERRICFGRRQLAEKLLARRESIDDRGLECLKLVLLRDYLRELFTLVRRNFSCGKPITRISVWSHDDRQARPVLDVTVERQKLQRLPRIR
jgi:hypothetical protein